MSKWGKKSPLYCNHANEAPNVCPCPEDCYCKDFSCKSRPSLQTLKAAEVEDKLRNRLREVWNNFVDGADDSELADIKHRLNEWLDELNSQDVFGTEGQNDPRGDQRNVRNRPSI